MLVTTLKAGFAVIYLKSLRFDASVLPAHKKSRVIPILNHLDSLKFRAPVSFLVGDNGAGKSTILESIAACLDINTEGGTKNFTLQPSREDDRDIHKALAIERNIYRPKDYLFYRAETYFNLMSKFDDNFISQDYFSNDLHKVSRGEGFLELINNRLFGKGLYLFDEPESGLSLHMQLAFLNRIKQLVDNHSQFIIATHSPLLLMYPEAHIFQCDAEGVTRVGLEESDLFSTWDAVFNHRETIIKELL